MNRYSIENRKESCTGTTVPGFLIHIAKRLDWLRVVPELFVGGAEGKHQVPQVVECLTGRERRILDVRRRKEGNDASGTSLSMMLGRQELDIVVYIPTN